MNVEPSFFHKLWDKGIDISASIIATTISAGIVAVIATLTWRWKRERDLKFEEDKVRQHSRIDEELLTLKRKAEERAPIQKMMDERERFAIRAEACQNLVGIASVVSDLIRWSSRSGIASHLENALLIGNWYDPKTFEPDSPGRFGADIRRIAIPGE